MSQVVPPSFLFRWAFPVRQSENLPRSTGRLLDLPETCRIASVSELDSAPQFADLRLAWNDRGLGVSVEVRDRSRPLRSTTASPYTSDGLHIWLDTRHTHTVHRATKYCQQFSLLPARNGGHQSDPMASANPLARAREDSVVADASLIQIRSEVRRDGYWLEAWLPAETLVGFTPAQHPRLGFHYVVRDSERGEQSFSGSHDFPYATDPSLWQTLELLDD